MIHANKILTWLKVNNDLDKIKFVIGVRGYGKTTILKEYSEWLSSGGVPKENIIYIDFEHPGKFSIHAPNALMQEIESRLPAEGRVHLLLDEICELQSFNVVLSRLLSCKRYNIIATGSARRPISSRYMEYLDGHFVYKQILPYAFDCIPQYPGKTFDEQLDAALRMGTFPRTFKYRNSPDELRVYLTGLWHTILAKDILSYNRLSDASLAELLLEHIYRHLGETESLRKISADAKISGHAPAPNTVLSYIEAFDESFLLKRLQKYDAFLCEIIKGGYRFYFADIALGYSRYGILPNHPENCVRNIIFLELRTRRIGNVYCGRYDKEDFDFVSVLDGEIHCWHYVPKTTNGRIPAAILGPFKRMPVEIKKTIITRNTIPTKPIPGIEFVTLENFLSHKTTD